MKKLILIGALFSLASYAGDLRHKAEKPDDMVNLQELRENNHISKKGELVICTLPFLSDLFSEPKYADQYDPIELTEAKIKELGFLKQPYRMSNCDVYQLGKYRILHSGERNYYGFCIEGIAPATLALNEKRLQFVHQVQNIIFDLNGQMTPIP